MTKTTQQWSEKNLHHLRQLSPLRSTTTASDPLQLAEEQARHFGIDPQTEYGTQLVRIATNLFSTNLAVHDLWKITLERLQELDRNDRIAWFNAKRFLSFQFAKILDTLQNPTRSIYQSLVTHHGSFAAKGAYPVFDNVTAVFSASPVIARTATYLFACTEWIEDAFKGKEPLHEIYSRLLNPTAVSLANHIVDIECGKRADQYMAWNFNSGMAAIDGVMSHLVGYKDILLVSQNIYGGAYQLLHDWYGKRSNLDVALEWVNGYDAETFAKAMNKTAQKYAERIAAGKQIYLYIESPCNPHGFVLDVAGISRAAHERGWQLIVDTTVGTPFLHPVLKREDPMECPDFVIHSYTKDLAGFGVTTAGCVIGRNEDMFMPKGHSIEVTRANGSKQTVNWDETMFWNVYYVKGSFLDSDKAFEVLNGMKTFEMRLLSKAINTITLARIFEAHPHINVSCPIIESNPNHQMLKKYMHLGLPAALFTIDVEGGKGQVAVSQQTYKKFFDMLEPAIAMQVSLGQTNTVALCPAMTTHSELSDEALKDAGILPTTTRISVGMEDPRIFVAHLQKAAEMVIDPECPGFSQGFPSGEKIDEIYRSVYTDVHQRFIAATPQYEKLTA